MRWERVHLKGAEGGGRGRKGGTAGPGKRWGHTCNALKNGRSLYVFGGYGKDNRQTNDVHVFDTAKQTWSKPMVKGTPPSPRDSHTSTTVGTSLYVFGGTDGKNPLQDLYILDTVTNTWSKPQLSGDGPASREGHSAALIGLNIFIFGGCGKSSDETEEVYFDDLYILDTVNLHWTKAETKGIRPVPRDSHSCSCWDDKLVVLGGEDASDSYLADVQILHTDVMEWRELRTTGQQLTPRAGHVTVAAGKHLFVFGGFTDDRKLFDDLHMLDLETGVWSNVITDGVGPSPRFSIAGDCVDARTGGILAFIGGCNDNLEALDDMYYLDTEIQSEKMQDERPEKYSLRKELKRKRQGNQPPIMKSPPAIALNPSTLLESAISAPVATSPGVGAATFKTSIYEFKPAEEKIFEAKIMDVFHYGYTIESVIDGKLLRGLLFSYKPGFTHAVHAYLTRKKLLSDRNAGSAREEQISNVNTVHMSACHASSVHGSSTYFQPQTKMELLHQTPYQQPSHFIYQQQVSQLHCHASPAPYQQELFSNFQQVRGDAAAPTSHVSRQEPQLITEHRYGETWVSTSETSQCQAPVQSSGGFSMSSSCPSQALPPPVCGASVQEPLEEDISDVMQAPASSQVTSLPMIGVSVHQAPEEGLQVSAGQGTPVDHHT